MEYGRCQNGMDDFKNGMDDFKNGMKDNLSYFHTNSILDFVHCIYKKIYGWPVVINNTVTEVFNFNINAYYLLTNQGTLVVLIAQTVYVLHCNTCIAICSIYVTVGFDRVDFFYF